jgi:alkylation response protein AidB-like acyl-CoA dehydrogenase
MPLDTYILETDMMAPSWPWGLPAGLILPELAPGISDLSAVFGALALGDELRLPLPGGGRTWDRYVALAEVAAVDLSLGRLVEGHTDALAILAEAGRTPPPRAVLGVWAARGPGAVLVAHAEPGGGFRLQGRKPWASGAHVLTHALVTAATPDGDCLFEVPVGGDGVAAVPGTWPAVGMAMSDSADVTFDIMIGADSLIGPAGWYVSRPGFWFGSVGVAACWLGGAVGLVRALRADLAQRRPDPHQLAHLGAASARCTSMARDLEWGATRIDAAPSDPDRDIRLVALEVRHLVENGCLEVLTHVGRAGGAAPLCHDPAQARRAADLQVYVRQYHAERDDEALGQSLMTERSRS